MPCTRPLMSGLQVKPERNHSATEKDTVLKLVNIFSLVSIFITWWEEDGDVLYIILGHILDQSLRGKQERGQYWDHATRKQRIRLKPKSFLSTEVCSVEVLESTPV